MFRRYAGEFLEFDAQGLDQVFSERYIGGEVWWSAKFVRRILSARTLPEMDTIASRIDSVIQAEAARMINEARQSNPKKATAADIEQTRRGIGDITLWVSAGAQLAAGTAQTKRLPQKVTPAECFAVLALWKALRLQQVVKGIFAPKPWMEDLTRDQSRPDVDAEPVRVALHTLLPWFREIGELSAEVAKAETLATAAEDLEGHIESAEHRAVATYDGLLEQDLADTRRSRGSEGGTNRAKKYDTVRQKIIKIYTSGDYDTKIRSVASAIVQRLAQEKNLAVQVAPTFVAETIRNFEHSRSVNAARNRNQGS
jgi:hypothetical protein